MTAPNPTLVEVNEWVWPSHCHQHEAVLRHGQLLRWMDIAACLSGEPGILYAWYVSFASPVGDLTGKLFMLWLYA